MAKSVQDYASLITENYDSTQRSLISMGLKFFGSTDRAADLAQDTWAHILPFIDEYDPSRGSFKTWVLQIGKNLAVSLIRKIDAERRAMDRFTEEIPRESFVSNQGAALDSEILSRKMYSALINLPDIEARLLADYLEGLRYREIAERREIPLGTVKSRLHEARRNLKNYLEVH